MTKRVFVTATKGSQAQPIAPNGVEPETNERVSLATTDWEGETDPIPAINAMAAYDKMGEHSLAEDWEVA